MVTLGAQQPQDSAADSQGLIRLDFEVSDPTGAPVTGLAAGDFTLSDNGKPSEIVTFQAFSDTALPPEPVELIFVIDLMDLNSRTSALKGNAAEAAVERFLRRPEGRLNHPTSVYVLTSDGLSGSPEPSTDGNAVAQAIADRSLPGRRRSRTDEIFHLLPLQAESLGTIALEQRLRPARKVLIWIGPGWAVNDRKNDALFLTIVELATRLRESRITVWGASQWPYPRPGEDPATTANPEFAEWLNDSGWPAPRADLHYPEYMAPVRTPSDARSGNLALAVLAAHTGGGMMMTRSIEEAFAKRAARVNDYYSITFDPARTSQVDEYHEIKLEVAKSNLNAHVVSGYYDEPVYYDQPAAPRERLSVAQLEAKIAAVPHGGERELEKELKTAELTERLSAERWEALQKRLPDSKSKEALEVLADRAEFLPPPSDDIVAAPAPDTTAQNEMLARTRSYLEDTLARLPNFIATRTTGQFAERGMPGNAGEWKTLSADESLHLTQTAKTTVLIRNGKEVAEKTSRTVAGEHSLLTEGTFGPVLGVMLARARGDAGALTWSRWERDAQAPIAVFRYSAPQPTGEVEEVSCCSAGTQGPMSAERAAGFHGEIAIDPATGALLRLTVEVNLKPRMAISRSAVMVEYAPQTIGGKSYICPVHSVAIARQRIEWALHEWNQSFAVFGRYETLLNDVIFSQYHLFRSESTILPGYTETNEKP